MKKRWTFELIIDTRFQSNEWAEDAESLSDDEATEALKEDLSMLLELLPHEFELMKFEAREVE